jgi:hypothetical protein
MSHVAISIDEQDLPAVLEILHEKGIAVAEPAHGRWVGGEVGATAPLPEGHEVGGRVGEADALNHETLAARQRARRVERERHHLVVRDRLT